MHKHAAAFLLSATLLFPSHGWAQTKPVELKNAIRAAVPVGAAKLRKLTLHIYDASFWSDNGDWKKAPYALSITYAMNFTAEELAERTLSEMEHVSDLPKATLRTYADRLAKLWPDLKEGDRVTALARADGSTMFYHNGKPLGAIADAKFCPAFFGIWLSPQSSEPEMRNRLLNAPEE